MVFKGELFFLDCEESTLISYDFTNKKDNILGTNWLLLIICSFCWWKIIKYGPNQR